ncbi:PASTA domain-containing protein [Caulobacter endophyticus]|uniref:PASTA domain-containing protein n=1 Tax=Caulobacter endophyticus TaxID=2172652 RepID=A0A2T9KD54_9CAUL|nr:PASTA domain-containing protein [Caulobacter endophyticus]PVM93829.1 hypothetical protein DDF67_02650 [Caulobacter endophyticus]
MSTAFSWTARLTDADGNAAAGAGLDVQLFDLKAGAWASASSAKTAADGTAKGAGSIADDTLPFAPAFRLVEGAGVISASPEFTRNARTGALAIDFGQVRRLAPAETVIARTLSVRTLRTAAPIGGVVATDAPIAPTVDAAAIRALAVDETTKTFTARIARSDQDLAARDTQIAAQSKQLADKDAQIATLRAEKVDVAAVRAQAADDTAKTFNARLLQRDQDLAARDSQLADRSRIVAEQDKEITTLRATLLAKDLEIADIKATRTADPATGAAATGAGATAGVAAGVINPAIAASLRTVAVTDLATTMATQLDTAQKTLKPTGFSLGAIQVSAKGILRDSGSMEFLDADTLKTLPQDSLSDLKFQFIPEKVASEDDGPRTPDVLQLTESAVRRVLTSVGLVLEASTGPRGLNPAVAPGQAMVQSPAAGTVIARGARVMVIFADEQGA